MITEIWLVNMGIGEMVKDKTPMRAFRTKVEAYNWVEKHFKEQIEVLNNYRGYLKTTGINIGNSFSIYKINLG